MAGIYIHVPFCKKLCSYCDFYHIKDTSDHKDYITALVREMEIQKEYLGSNTLSTIYFGGGTPSVLRLDEVADILRSIRVYFKLSNNCELTIEVNPDDISDDYLKGLIEAGINRISIGVQSWNNNYLRLLNRRHNSAQAIYAVEEAMKAGFGNVTIDLIYGIPGMTTSEWASYLDLTFSTGINHLSAYHLTFEPNTLIWKLKEEGRISEIDEEESNTQFNLLIEKADNAGFVQYEISNFGKPGFFSVHNMNYWKQVNYLGIGPSAHSFNGYSRQWNIKDLDIYIKAINSGDIFFEKEELNIRTRFNEYIMTSLRTMWGIDLEYIEYTFEKEGFDYVVNMAGKFIDYGLMKQDKKNLVLTNQGKMISDNIISELILPGDE